MRVMWWTLTGCLLVGLAGCGDKDTKPSDKGKPASNSSPSKPEATNKEKILGTWEVKKVAGKDMPPGNSMEFMKDGKMKASVSEGGKTQSEEGTYEVDGDKITTVTKVAGKENKEVATIDKLTDTELVVKDKKGELTEFKKK